MNILQIMLSSAFLLATAAYFLCICIALPVFDRIHNALHHSILEWPWDHIAMPVLRACLMLLFIGLAYPVLFGVEQAPALVDLLGASERRANLIINIVFLVTLLFPLVPVLGDREELVLPLQGVAASGLLFSWLAEAQGNTGFTYWPGFDIVVYIIILAFAAHWLGLFLARHLGEFTDRAFNLEYSHRLLAKGLVLFLQSPAILLFSSALGEQLAVRA